jgi:hypothetical protein
MASTYQTNRAGSGGTGGGSSTPYVQSVVLGDWNTSSTPGTQASFFGSVAQDDTAGSGFTGTITIQADNPGLAGNVNLTAFGWSGGDTVNQIVSAYNLANPGNTLTVLAGGIEYPDPAETIQLTGGTDLVADPDYTLTIAESSHSKGTGPSITLYEAVGGIFEEVDTYVAIDATGNITIKVPVNPDGRFTGKIVVN